VRLSNEEKESIISFDETNALANIFTYNKRWQRHLEKNLGLKVKNDNGYGGREYEIEKKRIPLPRTPRKLSPDQRARMSARMAHVRPKTQIIISESARPDKKLTNNITPNHTQTKKQEKGHGKKL
jgi:hypothetical protein